MLSELEICWFCEMTEVLKIHKTHSIHYSFKPQYINTKPTHPNPTLFIISNNLSNPVI